MTETLPELRYEYQPKDEEGRPLGRPQVIKYHTQEELIQKLTDQNTSVIREMRILKRRNIDGVVEREEIPATAPHYTEPVAFEPRALADDERLAVARDLQDPAKMETAFNTLSTAAFGAPPSKVREALSTVQQGMTDAQVKIEVQKFLQSTPDYYICKENFDTIHNWMVRYELMPTAENFTLAFTRLTEAGILLQSPSAEPIVAPVEAPVIVTEGPDTFVQPVVAPVETPAAEEEVSPYVRINTGLSGMGTTSGGGPLSMQPGGEIVYTRPAVVEITRTGQTIIKAPAITYTGYKALDAMSPEEYRQRFNSEPGFKAKVDAMEKARKWSPNQR
jgi:hypothetical protein